MPLSASNLQFQDYQFRVVTPQGVWRWTTRVDLSLANPSYVVRDVLTPFGILRDSIPLPGAVVLEMANGIALLQQQFAPNILLDPITLTFTVDEGRGVSTAQTILITNNGVFGSLLGVSLSTSAPYLKTSVASLGGLASNVAGSFGVMADSTALVSDNSPYAATLTIQDPAAINNPRTVAVAIVVRPRATITLSVLTLNFAVTKPVSGAFPAIPVQTFDITNTGPAGSLLDFQTQRLLGGSEWLLSFNPTEGELESGSTQQVSVVLQCPEDMGTGTYTETLRVSGYSLNFFQDIVLNLVIS